MSQREWKDGLDIVFDFAHKAIGEKEPSKELLYQKFSDFLLSTGSTKPVSAKNLQRLYRHVFSVRLSPNAHMFAQYTYVSAKHLVYKNPSKGPTYKSVVIKWYSTPRGLLYTAQISNSPVLFLVLSHVFDRMSQRAFDNDMSRMAAIGEFFWKTLQKGGTIFTNSECETMMFGEHGLYLGYGYCAVPDDNDDMDIRPLVAEDLANPPGLCFVVLKTFVNDLKPWQEKKREWMEKKGGYFWKADLTHQTHENGLVKKDLKK